MLETVLISVSLTPRLRGEVEFVLDVFAESLHRGEDEVMDIFGPDFEPHERRALAEASLFR